MRIAPPAPSTALQGAAGVTTLTEGNRREAERAEGNRAGAEREPEAPNVLTSAS